MFVKVDDHVTRGFWSLSVGQRCMVTHHEGTIDALDSTDDSVRVSFESGHVQWYPSSEVKVWQRDFMK